MEDACCRDPKNGGKRIKINSNKNNNNNNNGCHNQDEEDRLSSLFDPLLVEILSLLPIQSAAATSVLSQRWRHLWTRVTSLRLSNSGKLSALFQILPQLTSPLIRALVIPSIYYDEGFLVPAINSCFDHIRCRNDVEIIEVTAWIDPEVKIPAWVYQCQSLVTLNLYGFLKLDLIGTNFNLPNLKNISLQLYRFPTILTGTIFTSCPLLERLSLIFWFPLKDEHHLIDVSAPNLKSLDIELSHLGPTRLKFMINAPILSQLLISHYFSSSHFSFFTIPSALEKARLRLLRDEAEYQGVRTAATTQVTDLVQGITSVRSLELIESSKMLHYLGCMYHGALPIFRNLTFLELEFDSDRGCWKDLLLSLRCFPNLEVLKVSECPFEKEDLSWLESLPTSSLSKLKIMEIKRLPVYDSDKVLLGYILSNANALEKLSLEVSVKAKQRQIRLWKEYEFSETLFKLPRSSPACKIELHGDHINASSDAYSEGSLACQLLYGPLKH